MVMRTLPISRRDVALYRWWMAIGMPALVSALFIGLAWLNHRSSWPLATSQGTAVASAVLATVAALGVMSVLPLPALTSNLSNFVRFTTVWIVLAGFALYGFPVDVVTTPIALALGVAGLFRGEPASHRQRRGQAAERG